MGWLTNPTCTLVSIYRRIHRTPTRVHLRGESVSGSLFFKCHHVDSIDCVCALECRCKQYHTTMICLTTSNWKQSDDVYYCTCILCMRSFTSCTRYRLPYTLYVALIQFNTSSLLWLFSYTSHHRHCLVSSKPTSLLILGKRHVQVILTVFTEDLRWLSKTRVRVG